MFERLKQHAEKKLKAAADEFSSELCFMLSSNHIATHSVSAVVFCCMCCHHRVPSSALATLPLPSTHTQTYIYHGGLVCLLGLLDTAFLASAPSYSEIVSPLHSSVFYHRVFHIRLTTCTLSRSCS